MAIILTYNKLLNIRIQNLMKIIMYYLLLGFDTNMLDHGASTIHPLCHPQPRKMLEAIDLIRAVRLGLNDTIDKANLPIRYTIRGYLPFLSTQEKWNYRVLMLGCYSCIQLARKTNHSHDVAHTNE
jgi:hypothetical protein